MSPPPEEGERPSRGAQQAPCAGLTERRSRADGCAVRKRPRRASRAGLRGPSSLPRRTSWPVGADEGSSASQEDGAFVHSVRWRPVTCGCAGFVSPSRGRAGPLKQSRTRVIGSGFGCQ